MAIKFKPRVIICFITDPEAQNLRRPTGDLDSKRLLLFRS
jgi:hypothetical protein